MDPFIGEVRLFSFSFAPMDWAFCDGTTQYISQNQALFSLLGTTYGGDGRNTFNLPNIMGYAAMGTGTGAGLTPRYAGSTYGVQNATVTASQTPQHTHTLETMKYSNVSKLQDKPSAEVTLSVTNNQFDYSSNVTIDPLAPPATMSNKTVDIAYGGSGGVVLGHSNISPYLALNFCICMYGIYPDRP